MPQFLILAEDYKDSDALNRRLAIRETHLARMLKERTHAHFIIGGAKLNTEGNMHGSMLVVELENEQAVWEWINKDPYMTNKVWEHVQVFPFRIAAV